MSRTTIRVYSKTATALDLHGAFGSEVDSNVVSSVNGNASAQELGCTVLSVADADVGFVETELQANKRVKSFSEG